jgi:hypothetical protein
MLRPPIAWIAVAFGAGLWAGLSLLGEPGSALLVLAAALPLSRRAPLGAALGIMAVAGSLGGAAAVRERAVTCAGVWGEEGRGMGEGCTHGAIV